MQKYETLLSNYRHNNIRFLSEFSVSERWSTRIVFAAVGKVASFPARVSTVTRMSVGPMALDEIEFARNQSVSQQRLS